MRNLAMLFVSGLMFWISVTIFLPTLPAYIEDVGATPQQVGFVIGAFAIGLLISRSQLGKMADRRGCQIVLLIGTAVAWLAPLGYIISHSIPQLLLIRMFHGISVAAFTTGYNVLVVNLSPVKQRGELIGYMNLAVPVGMSIGPAIGGFLGDSYNYLPVFLTSTSVGLFAFFLTMQIKEKKPDPSLTTNNDHLVVRSPWKLLTSPALSFIAVILLLVGLQFGAIVTFLALFIRDSKIDLNPGLFFTAGALASFIVRFLVGKASDRYGRGLFITLGVISYGLAMLLLALYVEPEMILIAGILQGAGGGIVVPMMIALMSDRSQAHERGQVFSICTSGFDLGGAIAGPLFGSLVISYGYPSVYGLAAVLSLIALGIIFTISNKSLHDSFGFALGKAKDRYAL